MDDPLGVVSLFSGAGGLDVGMHATGGYRLLGCVELEGVFCDTLRRNRDSGLFGNPGTVVHQADISQLEPGLLMDMVGTGPGELDVLVGGPPCQSFSTAGKRGGTSDRRGRLLWDYLRFLATLRPRYFVMENVRGLLSASSPGGPKGSVLGEWVADLSRATGGDYTVRAYEVNAVNYGAPQLRERVLFIGSRDGTPVGFPGPTHGPGRLPFATLGDALAGFTETDPVLVDFSPRKKEYLRQVPPGGNWRMLPDDVAGESMGRAYHAKGGRSGWWRRLSWGLPCPTITTLPNHSSTSLCHPTETRVLSVGECARVQGFPDGWDFAGTPSQQMRQVGNAVPVRLGEVVGRAVLDHHADGGGDTDVPRFERVYLGSHVRTRRWFADGRAVKAG